MVTIRNANELIESLKEFFRLNQPDLDTKPGTVARDLFIEAPATQLSLVYDELSKISDLQSLRLSAGADLDNLASNYGASRKTAVTASGIALITFASIPASIALNKGALVFSSAGTSFALQNSIAVSPTYLNLYRAVATKYRNELDFLGVTDQYAIEVAVSATTPGLAGNIPKYALTRTSAPGASNVTNVTAFFGGANAEDDATFRNRVLSIFSGSNVGTALGYQNIVTADSQVLDAIVIQPGDPLMVRDGTQVVENSDGSFTIISEGQGGKVDVIILGLRESEYVDSFIYRDLSNKNDPTDTKNIFVIGQISGDENKTVNRRRLDNLAAGTLPAQPVDNIVEVTGSGSGGNFKAKSVDSLGRVTGNYELIKDTGVYAGSPFGFDKFHWISDRISDLEEDKVKGRANGQDAVNYTDVISVSSVMQNVSIQNENSSVSNADRSSVTVIHKPCSGVTRVFNLTTGERYSVTSQNPDGTGSVNETGRVTITGNTLPSPSDVLQVDYTWLVEYDPYVDFDGRLLDNNPRVVTDSIDWGYSNAVRSDVVAFELNDLSTLYLGTASHAINSVVSVNTYLEATGTVSLVTSGVFANKLAVNINALAVAITSVSGVKLTNTNKEIYVTAEGDGSFSSTQVIISGVPKHNLQVILPTDSSAIEGDVVTVTYNEADIYTVSGVSGNFSGKQITVPVNNYLTGPTSFTARVNYIADVQDLFNVKLSELPVAKNGNGFVKSGAAVKTFSNPTTTFIKEFQTVGSSSSLTLTANNSEFSMTEESVATVVRVSDGYELWNADNVGTVSAGIDGSFVLTLSGAGAPVSGDSAIVVYSLVDTFRTQPMTFRTNIISTTVTAIQNLGGVYYVEAILPAGIDATQVGIIRISDGVDLADANATLDFTADTITLSDAGQLLVSGSENVIVVFYTNWGVRQAPTRLSATLSDQTNNSGTITIKGTTVTRAAEIIFTAINTGLQQNLSEAVRSFYGLLSTASISTSLSVARMVKLERVNMTDNEVVSVDVDYDVELCKINNGKFFANEVIEDLSLDTLDFVLPSTTNNTDNAPEIGDKLRVTFYIANNNDSEDLFFTRNGTVYGNKFFGLITRAVVSSGFAGNTTGRITVSSFNQPVTGTRYKVFYDYLAPKPNERIVIRSNYNKLIGDATITLEPQRPINADVLIKAAQQILVNIEMAIVVKSEYVSSSAVVLQNVKDQVISAINTNVLADVIDSSDLTNVAYGVAGVDRVRIVSFNKDQAVGQVLSLTAQKNQYFVSNTVTVTSESR